MVEQYQDVKTFLGEDFFINHPHPRIRAAHGFCFLKKMTMDVFYERSLELRKSLEDMNEVE